MYSCVCVCVCGWSACVNCLSVCLFLCHGGFVELRSSGQHIWRFGCRNPDVGRVLAKLGPSTMSPMIRDHNDTQPPSFLR